MKSGVNTSELWTGMIGLLTMILSSQLPASDGLKLAAMICASALAIAYIASRTVLKVLHPESPAVTTIPTVLRSHSPDGPALPTVLTVLALLALAIPARAGDVLTADVGSRQGDLHAGIRLDLTEAIAPASKANYRRALHEAAVHPTPENIGRLAQERGALSTIGRIPQICLIERQVDLGMCPGVMYAAAVAGTPDAQPVQVLLVTNYAERSFSQRLGAHIERNATAYTVSGIGAALAGVYYVGAANDWWGGSDSNSKATGAAGESDARLTALPTVQGGPAPTVVVQSSGSGPVSVNINMGGEGNVTGGGTGGASTPAETVPAETPAP